MLHSWISTWEDISSLVIICSGEQVVSPPQRVCYSPVEQKWNSTSAIIEQRGCKISIWAGKEKRVEGEQWKKVRQCEKLGNNWKSTDSWPNPFLFLCLLYSKRNRQGYTVNVMIHNIEEVNIRERNDMVNKCRHQKGIWTLRKLAFLSTGDNTQYSTSFTVNTTMTLSFTQNHIGT